MSPCTCDTVYQRPWPLTMARTRDRGVTTWTILKAHLSNSVFDLVFSGFAPLLKTRPGRGRRWVPVKQSEEIEYEWYRGAFVIIIPS